VDWTDFALIGGLCTVIAGFAFFFGYIVPRAGTTRPGSADEERFDCLRDLCAAAVFAGCVLVSLATFANSTRHPALSLAGVVMWVWSCGFFVGRASLRRRRRTQSEQWETLSDRR
jgi:hypothetical protein